MGFKKILSRKTSERSSSHSLPMQHNILNLGLNVKDTLVASYAMMSTTIAEHFSNDEEEHRNKMGMYHKNSSYESAIIHPVQCKRDIYVDKVVREKGKRRKQSYSNISPYKNEATNSFKNKIIDTEISDNSIRKTQLRIKTVGIQPGHLRVETRVSTETPRRESLGSDSSYSAHLPHMMVEGYAHRSTLHTDTSPSSTISSVTIPVELDMYTPKEILNNMMKSPQQMFVMCAIDEGSDGEITEL